MIKSCIVCGKDFKTKKYGYGRIVCFNTDCIREKKRIDSEKDRIKRIGYLGYQDKNCKICEKQYSPNNSKSKYCSNECRKTGRRKYKNNHQKEFHKKMKDDRVYRLKKKLRDFSWRCVHGKKDRSILDIIDYDIDELRYNIENKFVEGMSWGNYGEWHIDHIRPLCSFNFFDDDGNVIYDEIKKALSIENMQPLWASENCRKGGRYDN